jgi:S-adenosylmethionine/arginine decarboxylase-like enzyme
MIVHHHAIIIATVRRPSSEIRCEDLKTFLSGLVDAIGMQKLFEPIAIHGKFGFTGIVGIVTSHIAFHYFDADRSLHFDVYSCKEYDLRALLRYLDQYWDIESSEVVFLKRDQGPTIEKYAYSNNQLTKE